RINVRSYVSGNRCAAGTWGNLDATNRGRARLNRLQGIRAEPDGRTSEMSCRRGRRLRNLVSRAVDAEFLHSAPQGVGGQFEDSRGALRPSNDSARMREDCFNMAPLRFL